MMTYAQHAPNLCPKGKKGVELGGNMKCTCKEYEVI